jgi:hypothetical protein
VIYSQWKPDTGRYEYYESAERYARGDDLPVPRLRATSPIGVPSTEIGRTPTQALRRVGEGEHARGMILPLSRVGLLGSTTLDSIPTWVWVGLGVAAGYVLSRPIAKMLRSAL